MPGRLNEFLTSLRDLAKAHERLARAVPNPRAAEREADRALERTLRILDDPSITGSLAQLLPTAKETLVGAPEVFDQELAARRSQLIEIETGILRRAGANDRDVERLYLGYEMSKNRREQFPDSVTTIKAGLIDVHNTAKQRIQASRSLCRRSKKQRKRKVGQGIASAIFGAAAIIGDTQLPPLFAFSYGVGGGALHQALRDIVGEPTD